MDRSLPAASAIDAAAEKAAFREAIRQAGPAMPGIFAWAVVTGMAMVKTGLTVWQALAMTFIVFAGSAQLAALPLIASHAPAWLFFVTAMVVNLRFVIFAASVGPHFAHLPWHRRLFLGYLNCDLGAVFFSQRYPFETVRQALVGKLGCFKGISYLNWWTWQVGSVLGILLASQIPDGWGIGFAGTLALLAITVPLVVNLPTLIGVAVAGALAVGLHGLPYRLGLVAGIVAGVAAAMTAESLQSGEGEHA